MRFSTLQVPTFRPVEIQPSQIRFEWTLPSHDQNGVLIGFTVSYGILVWKGLVCFLRISTDIPTISNRVRHRPLLVSFHLVARRAQSVAFSLVKLTCSASKPKRKSALAIRPSGNKSCLSGVRNHRIIGFVWKSIIQFSYLVRLAPPKPGKKEVPEVLTKTTTSVKLQFKKGLFSDENGQVCHSAYFFTIELLISMYF